MISAPGPDRLSASAEWLPFMLDPETDRVRLLRLDEAAYKAAPFLDQRALPASPETVDLDWAELAAAVPPAARRDVQYIFHAGNVGSTLISRLLGERGDILALREPLLLRTFFEMLSPPARWDEQEATARLGTLTTLLSRTFRSGQRALVKATSFTSEIGPRLVPLGSRALLLTATPSHYVENILAGPNSRAMLPHHTPVRVERLKRRGIIVDPATLDEARQAALGWACEMLSLGAVAEALGEKRTLWVDFDRFLEAPAPGLAAIAAFFGHAMPDNEAAAICEGPLMRRYSKALEYEYSPELRREILAEARWNHQAAINGALDWLSRLAGDHPALGRVMKRL